MTDTAENLVWIDFEIMGLIYEDGRNLSLSTAQRLALWSKDEEQSP